MRSRARRLREHALGLSGRRAAGGLLAPAAAAIALFLAPSATADVTEPIRVTFTAPAGCPDTDAFTAEVTARTAKARLASPGEPARSFTVTITTSGKKARGKLIIDDPRGPSSSREVSGESCAEVASALALVTALAIDPNASTAAKPPPPPPKPPPPPPMPHVLLPPRDPRPPPPYTSLPWWGPLGSPLPAAPSAPPSPRWRFTAALHAGIASGVAPGVVPAITASVDVSRLGESVLSPAFRLSLSAAQSGYLAVGSGFLRARFRWMAGRVEGCPIRVAIAGPLAAYPCALVDAGALEAVGLPYQPAATTRPWVAPGVLGRFHIALFEDVQLELQGGATFPLVRDTFQFTDPAPATGTTVAHQVPVAGGFVSGGVGMHFP
jgi:hypothetical protein